MTENTIPVEKLQELQKEEILRYFSYRHLKPELQEISKPFAESAYRIALTTPQCEERSVALRKILEAKDAAVRAAMTIDGATFEIDQELCTVILNAVGAKRILATIPKQDT